LHHPPSKRSPVINSLSAAITLVLLAGLGVAAWLSGGEVFNPGPLSAKSKSGVVIETFTSHADFEGSCARCHQPLSANQVDLCEKCHTDVSDQVSQSTGTHGRIKNVEKCAACHTDHKGRDFDPSHAALNNFNHNVTVFPLTNQHALTPCKDCHANNNYQHISSQCSSCHKEPGAHAGMFGQDCAQCHNDTAWKPAEFKGAAFDHEKTAFSLAKHSKGFDGQPLGCVQCHSPAIKPFETQKCVECHSGRPAQRKTIETVAQPADFLSTHIKTFGQNCLVCHDGADRMNNFDHNKIFILDGKHAALTCEQCHADQKFAGTPSQCSACHKEPDIHKGFFGLKCEYCHNSEAWSPALLHAHNFPLDHGGKSETDCKTCHTGSYAQYTCYGCHDHQADAIKLSHEKVGMPAGVTLEQCTACHLDGKVKK
jgi:hypothetical protein